MTPYTIHGITFMADEEGRGAFDVFNPDSPAANDLAPYGMVEELKAFIRLTADMKTFVDVGALFGIFSLVFTRNPDTKAYAIEASPWAFPILERHCKANPRRNIATIQAFAGEFTGTPVNCYRDWCHVMANFGRSGAERVTIHETALDDLIPLVPKVDCMKIDVEAYECQTLRGASGIIKTCRPLLFLECHMANLPDNKESAESLWNILSGFGYRLELSDGSPVKTLSDCSMTRVIGYPV